MRGAVPDEARFDNYDEQQMQNPYAMYAEFREKCPVGRSQQHGGFYFASTYDDARKVFSDFRTFSSQNGIAVPGRPIRLYPVDLDPPVHGRFRRIVNRHFTEEAAEAARPAAVGRIHDAIDAFIARGHADLASELVRKTLGPTVLPIIGVPLDELERFAHWVDLMVRRRATDPHGAADAAQALFAHVINAVQRRRKHPGGDDVLQSLIDADLDGERFSDEDVARTLVTIIGAGIDTTSVAILESLLHLARHPGDADRLRRGDLSWGVAIEELVRLFSPVTAMGRTVVRQIELGGRQLQPGDFIYALPGAANRDPEQFAEADRCVLDRAGNPHLSFGMGAHICLGRHVARMLIQAIGIAVLDRLPDFRPADDFVPSFEAFQGRAMRSLPVRFTPGEPIGQR